MSERDRRAKKLDHPRSERGPDPVPANPRGLAVPDDEWSAAWIMVLNFARRVTGSNARADDIRQEAYARLLTTRPWLRERQPSFIRHMMFVASSVLKHENKADYRRAGLEAAWGAEHNRERGVTTSSPEQDALDHAESLRKREWATKVIAELRRKLAGFPLELRLVDCAEEAEANDEELPKPAELAPTLGVSVQEIYRAFARIRRYRESVVAAVGGTVQENE